MARSCWLVALFLLACGSNSDDGSGSGGGGNAGGSGGSGATGGSEEAGVGGGSGGSVDAGSDAPVGEPGPSLGAFQLTYYWVTTEEEFSGPKDTDLYDSSCTLLATVPSDFADSLALEGTGRLSDGRVINTDGSCGCATSPCYLEVDAAHPWGYGVQNKALVPYRSFAVDKDEIAYGTKLYVAELDGVSVPGDAPWGGFVHDGCVSADDTGGAIVGKHVDWFVALKASYSTLDGVLGLNDVTVHEGGTRCP
jgi:3D (Asp-Asp-Asp) domain-containing protein